MSIKVFGIDADGTRHLIGMAPSWRLLLQFSFGINAQMLSYPSGIAEDLNTPVNGVPIWTIYDHPTDWPDWYVARLFINDRPTGNLWFAREIEPLRDELTQRGLTPMMRNPGDDAMIVETWV